MPQLRTPDRRTCDRCGRQEQWDGAETTWRVATVDGERRVGRVHCIHEWDINGSFPPFPDDED